MKKWDYVSKKEPDKSPEIALNEMEKSALSDSEFKITVITMLSKVRRAINVQSKNFSKEKILKSTKQTSWS